MNKSFKVTVTTCAFSKNNELIKDIREVFSNVTLNVAGKRYSRPELFNILKDVDAAVVGLDKIDDEVLEKCPDLKYVAKFGVGLDNIDFEAFQRRGVKILWRGGVNKTSVAELTLGFMLGLMRNILKTSYQLKKGDWNKIGGSNLSGKTIGIIGVGYAGKEVIRLLKSFNCRILVNDIIDQKEYYKKNGLQFASKEQIFKETDIVSLHVPLTDKTKNLINKDTLSIMKPTAYIVNTSRGLIVDEDDLFWALKNEKIAGAALDVYNSEPPANKELIKLDNLICTPHIGGNSKEATLAMGRSAINLLKEAVENESL